MKFKILLLLLLLTSCSKSTCLETKVIMNVGGCDSYGYCGVTFDDMTTGKVEYPTVMKKVCTKSE